MAQVAMKASTVVNLLLASLIVAGKAQFTVQPLSIERAEGLEAVFRCQYQVEEFDVTYNWAINNSLVTTATETVRDDRPPSPDEPATLTIVTTSQYDDSVVQCVARIVNGTDIVRSELSTTATLTVYATVITNVLNAPNTITVMWSALPITEYCVYITKITLDLTETMVFDSVCELTDQYIFTYSNPSVCDRFSFTVTPTDGEMRGTTSEPDTGFFTRIEGSGETHLICENGQNGMNKSVKFEATVPMCTRFTRYRVDSDILTIPINRSITDLQFNGLLDFPFPTDNKTDYNVTLTDENGIDLVFENIPISTFDVQDLVVSECPGSGGCISVSIEYVEGTVSPGALVCVMPIIDGVLDVASMRLVTIPYSMSENFIITLPSGSYRVIAFDLEKSAIPRIPISMAADSEDVTVNSGGEDTTSPPRPSREGVSAIKLPSGDVEVTCSDSALNCLALFRSPRIMDGLIFGFINSTYNSTVLSLMDTFGDGYVVVYSWNSSQSIFEGWESLFKRFDQPTTAPTTHPTADPQTDPLSPENESLSTAVSAGIASGALVVIIIVIVVAWCLVKKCKQGKVLINDESPQDPSTIDTKSSNSDLDAVDRAGNNDKNMSPPTTDHGDAPPLDYMLGKPTPENMSLGVNTADTDNEFPPGYDTQVEYETPSAKAGKPTFTSENPPPLPPPMIQRDSKAPDLQLPYNPAVDNESAVDLSVISQGDCLDTNDESVQGDAEDGASNNGRQEHQNILVETKPANSEDVVETTMVVYFEVDKDNQQPGTQVHGNDSEAIRPRQEKNNLKDPLGVDPLPIEESNQLSVNDYENDKNELKRQCNRKPKQKDNIHFEAGLPLNYISEAV